MKIVKYLVCGFICIILFSCTTPKYPDWITEQEVKANIDLVESWINDAEVFKAAMFDTVNYVTPGYVTNTSMEWVSRFCKLDLPIIQRNHSIEYRFSGFFDRKGPNKQYRNILFIKVNSDLSYYHEFMFSKYGNKLKLFCLKTPEKF